MRRRGAFSAAALVAAGAMLVPGPASAGSQTAAPDPNTPVPVTSPNARPLGFELTASQAERIAAGIPQIAAVLRHHRGAAATEYTRGTARWQVSWFTPHGDEIAQVIVNDVTGTPSEAWTGFQVAWPMARGAPGAFGHQLNRSGRSR